MNGTKKHMRRDLRRSEGGAALVEFALVVPILLLVVFGIINFGFVFGQKLSLNQSVREGARLAVVDQTAGAGEVTGFVWDSTGGLVTPASGDEVRAEIQEWDGSAKAFADSFTESGTCRDYERFGGQMLVTAEYQSSWLIPPFLPIDPPNLVSTAVFRCEVIKPAGV